LRTVNTIVVHHAASPRNWGVEDLRKFHVESRGWVDVGYHYVISADGTMRIGRPVWDVGAHAVGHNTNTVAIVLIGDLSKTPPPQEQLGGLVTLLCDLALMFGVKRGSILGHNELSGTSTLCPGIEMDHVRALVDVELQTRISKWGKYASRHL
jgi:N-acetylmuramoyl-L-alanine amidase